MRSADPTDPQGNKLHLQLIDWRAFVRNTLRGFASIKIEEMRLVVKEVAVSRWAQLPARPWVKDGQVVTDEATGKLKYQPTLEFDSRTVANAFFDPLRLGAAP
jgi:hypothetical protein